MVVLPLKGHGVFETVMRSGWRVQYGPLLVALHKSEAPFPSVAIGVGVSKKLVRKASMRNRVKRVLRVAVRLHISVIESIHTTGLLSIVVVWRAPMAHRGSITVGAVAPMFLHALQMVKQRWQ
jgi:ribonuclease P protein component